MWYVAAVAHRLGYCHRALVRPLMCLLFPIAIVQEPSEQGRIQGALSSLSALAAAVGPLAMRSVYQVTKNDSSYFGPGSMFLLAALMYLVAVYCAYLLPVRTNFENDSVG
jgi:hypothetical protein